MDVENDLEEQLTSYHICKLPTEPPAPEAPIKTEKEESLPRKKVRPDDTNGKVVERVTTSLKKPKYRLEVFTVESAQQSPQEILGDESEETVKNTRQRLAEEVKRKVSQKSSEPGHSAIASNSRTAMVSPEQASSARVWYQLPAQQEVETPPAISVPPPLIPTRVSARATKGQAPLRLLDLPDRVQLLAPPETPPPVQAPPVKSQRRRQNIITSPPVACIKIEDDDDDDVRIVSSHPAPAALPVVPQVQPAIEARHVIKLVTSVPVSKYPCEFCGRTFTLWNQRDSHMHTRHRISGVFTCFVCQKAAREYYITDDAIFSTEQYHFLQAHLAESHKITGQPRGFQCPYCSIHPANYEALVKHLTSDHDTSALRNTYVLVNVLEDRIEG